ncbi:MAG: JAB domain-containing protein [Sphingomonadales bacterium]
MEATLQVAAAAQTFEICVHDHVIVSRSGWTSLKAMGLLR